MVVFWKNLTILDPFEEPHSGKNLVKIDANSDLISTDANLPIMDYRFGPLKIYRYQKWFDRIMTMVGP